ncbi:hypothetical protein WS68_17740 [Burkholderia sp. TSV86]|nr:hypothetical protein WS68_17740 [Burkholderia sp. TSV86]
MKCAVAPLVIIAVAVGNNLPAGARPNRASRASRQAAPASAASGLCLPGAAGIDPAGELLIEPATDTTQFQPESPAAAAPRRLSEENHR